MAGGRGRGGKLWGVSWERTDLVDLKIDSISWNKSGETELVPEEVGEFAPPILTNVRNDFEFVGGSTSLGSLMANEDEWWQQD